MTVTPPEAVLDEVPELDLVPLAENERLPKHANSQGTRVIAGKLYHWLEVRGEDGRWRASLRKGVDRERQQQIIDAQRAHNEIARENKRRALEAERAEEEAANQGGPKITDKRRR